MQGVFLVCVIIQWWAAMRCSVLTKLLPKPIRTKAKTYKHAHQAKPSALFFVCLENARMPSSSGKTAAIAASTLICLAATMF